MAEPQFKAVVIDLFDTLVNWNAEGLPLVQFRGREMRSTAPLLFAELEAALGDRFDRDAFMEAHDAVYREIFAERSRDDAIEITCLERFTRTLARVGLPDGEGAPLADRLRKIHMGRVREITRAPAERVAAMKKIGQRFRIALVSNFDDGPTGHAIVRDTGLYDHFETVVISADTGLRKPNPRIFQHALDAMRLAPAEVLYVGDTPRDDVLGAKRSGMHSAWIRRSDRELPEDVPAPDIVIADLAELPAALDL